MNHEQSCRMEVEREGKGKDCGNRKNGLTPMPSLRKPSLCCDKGTAFSLSLAMRDIQSKRLSWKSLLKVLSFSLTSNLNVIPFGRNEAEGQTSVRHKEDIQSDMDQSKTSCLISTCQWQIWLTDSLDLN